MKRKEEETNKAKNRKNQVKSCVILYNMAKWSWLSTSKQVSIDARSGRNQFRLHIESRVTIDFVQQLSVRQSVRCGAAEKHWKVCTKNLTDFRCTMKKSRLQCGVFQSATVDECSIDWRTERAKWNSINRNIFTVKACVSISNATQFVLCEWT